MTVLFSSVCQRFILITDTALLTFLCSIFWYCDLKILNMYWILQPKNIFLSALKELFFKLLNISNHLVSLAHYTLIPNHCQWKRSLVRQVTMSVWQCQWVGRATFSNSWPWSKVVSRALLLHAVSNVDVDVAQDWEFKIKIQDALCWNLSGGLQHWVIFHHSASFKLSWDSWPIHRHPIWVPYSSFRFVKAVRSDHF